MIRKKKKNKICRKYCEDIWGEITYKAKENKITKWMYSQLEKGVEGKEELLYRVDVVKPKERRKRLSIYGELLSQRRKVCMFYGGMRRGELRRICKEGLKRGIVSDYVVGELERKLESVVYRMNFAISMEEARQRIRSGKIAVNKEVVSYPGIKIKEGDIVEVIPMCKEEVFKELKDRLEKE
jgi:ribosomal protein S4